MWSNKCRKITYMMKTCIRHIVCLFLVATLVSCANEDMEWLSADPANYIMFGQPSVSASTRAALQSFPDGGQFQVLGYLKSYKFTSTGVDPTQFDDNSITTPWTTKGSVTPPSVWGSDAVVNQTGTTVTYHQGGYCTYDNLTPWNEVENALYSFFYYYPASGSFSVSFDKIGGDGSDAIVGIPTLAFTMPFTGGDVATERVMDDIPDAMYGFLENVTRSNGTVNPQFNHLLAGLKMRINNYNTMHNVTVTSLRVYGSGFRRNMTLNNDFTTTVGSETFGGSFQFVDDAVTVEKVENAVDATGNFYEIDKTLLLIPYTSSSGIYFGEDIKVEISYSFVSGDKTATNDLAFGLNIEAGTIYTLQLNFVGDDLVLDFYAEQQWEDGNLDTGNNPGADNGSITFE